MRLLVMLAKAAAIFLGHRFERLAGAFDFGGETFAHPDGSLHEFVFIVDFVPLKCLEDCHSIFHFFVLTLGASFFLLHLGQESEGMLD